MNRKKKIFSLIAVCTLSATLLIGCDQDEIGKQQQTKYDNALKVIERVKTPIIDTSLERSNIRQRILVSNDPNTLQWIYPMSAGRVIGRFPVKGKVTSGAKRLGADEGYVTGNGNNGMQELPDEMGTYGSSGDYIFWFDPAGRIHQHKGDYFISVVPYKIEQGYGTISQEIDITEDSKRKDYENQMVKANKEMDARSKANGGQ